MNIKELTEEYKSGRIDFSLLLKMVPTLEWGTRHEGTDGEIWWEGENTVGDVDILWYDSIITDEERLAIMEAIPAKRVNIRQLIMDYSTGNLSFDVLLQQIPLLEWSKERETSDGEIWWDGLNDFVTIDAMAFEGDITEEEFRAIAKVLP